MLVGILIFIGVLHEHTHHTMKQDVHGVVKQFCRENPDTCISYGNNDYWGRIYKGLTEIVTLLYNM